MKNHYSVFSVFFGCLLGLCSCSDYVRLEIHQLSKMAQQDSLSFNFDVVAQQPYDIDLVLEHSDAYPYQNLYLKYDLIQNNELISSDTFSVELASESGEWQGDCHKTYCVYTYQLEESLVFPSSGPMLINVWQHSREEVLSGFKSLAIGLKHR